MKVLMCFSAMIFFTFLMSGCKTELPDTGDTGLVIGSVNENDYYITSQSIRIRAYEDASQESTGLDVDQDGKSDFEMVIYPSIYTNFDYEPDVDYYYEMRTSIDLTTENEGPGLNEKIEFNTQGQVDTVYRCEWASGVVSYTPNVGYECDGNHMQSIEEIKTGTFARNYSVGDEIDVNSSWTQESVEICRHDYYEFHDNGDSEASITTDIRRGILSWTEPQYVAFSLTRDGATHYGYVKFQLEQIDRFSWYLHVLESVLEK